MKSAVVGGVAYDLAAEAAEYDEWRELADGARFGRRWKTERTEAVKDKVDFGSLGVEEG